MIEDNMQAWAKSNESKEVTSRELQKVPELKEMIESYEKEIKCLHDQHKVKMMSKKTC